MVMTAEAPQNQLLPLQQRVPELGRIRLGEKGTRGEPVRLKTFRLTSGSRPLLEAAAKLYGGTVKQWDGAPDEGFWQLTTASAELDILIPGAAGAVSQSYELWQGGTCERRCDGTTVTTPKGAAACICAAKQLDGPDRECEIMTRIKVMLPRLPGLGVWRLDTGGYMAATTLPSTLTLLAQLSRGTWIPAVLRAEQRSRRVRDDNGKAMTHRFVVPVLDLPGATIGQLAEGAGLTVNMLEPGEPVAPPTARSRVAEMRAEIEAANTVRTVDSAPGSVQDGPQAAPGAGEAALVGAEATPPASAPARANVEPTDASVVDLPQCEALSPYEGHARCKREAGHPAAGANHGGHKASTKEAW